jgi:uncharacterized membrane protein
MATSESEFEVPTWVAVGLVVAVFLTFLYGILIQGTLFGPVLLWLWIGGIALSLFVVYLLYRFVIAVEKIADKM